MGADPLKSLARCSEAGHRAENSQCPCRAPQGFMLPAGTWTITLAWSTAHGGRQESCLQRANCIQPAPTSCAPSHLLSCGFLPAGTISLLSSLPFHCSYHDTATQVQLCWWLSSHSAGLSSSTASFSHLLLHSTRALSTQVLSENKTVWSITIIIYITSESLRGQRLKK